MAAYHSKYGRSLSKKDPSIKYINMSYVSEENQSYFIYAVVPRTNLQDLF